MIVPMTSIALNGNVNYVVSAFSRLAIPMISQTQPLKKQFVKHIEGTAPATTPHGRIKIVISLFLLYIIWGSTYLGMRIALEGFPPFVMVGLRYLTAGIILYTFLRLRGAPAPTRSQWTAAGLVG